MQEEIKPRLRSDGELVLELNGVVTNLLQQNRRLRHALEFYANRRNYNNHSSTIADEDSLIDDDCGAIARETLDAAIL
jgi:hypothetical protein